MNISKTIFLKGFRNKKLKKNVLKIFQDLITSESQILRSLSKSYTNSYNKNFVLKFKKFSTINLIGMGGSSLGARSIYSFLKDKIKKKKIYFYR